MIDLCKSSNTPIILLVSSSGIEDHSFCVYTIIFLTFFPFNNCWMSALGCWQRVKLWRTGRLYFCSLTLKGARWKMVSCVCELIFHLLPLLPDRN